MPKFPSSHYEQQPRPAEELPSPEVGLEKLLDANRIVSESRMIKTDSVPEAITDEQVREVIAAVKAYQKERRVSNATVARGALYSEPTISAVLKGNYEADPRPVVIAMDRWLGRRKKADQQPEVCRFVEMQVAKAVRLGAQMAIAAADAGVDSRIALAWGEAGCGKSLAAEAVAQAEDAILIVCGTGVMTSRAILESIAEKVRCGVSRSTRDTYLAVLNKLRGSGKLIIIDEIHALLNARDQDCSTFHMLRRLSDETGCPQLWLATCDLIEELKAREEKREPLGQITSRIGCQFHLTAKLHPVTNGGKPEPLYSVEEILAMFAGNELKLTREGGRFLANLCRDPNLGLLRSCVKLVLHATCMNRLKGGPITSAMLWEAATFLFQYSVIQRVKVAVGDDLKEMRLAASA